VVWYKIKFEEDCGIPRVYCVSKTRDRHVAIFFMNLSTYPSVNRSRGDIRCACLNSLCALLTFQLPAVVHITLNSAYFVRAALPSCADNK